MTQKVPYFGIVVSIFIVVLAVYASTLINSFLLDFVILFLAFFFVASAFVGLYHESRIAAQIINAGYIDQYIKRHGVGNQTAFKNLIQELKKDGYKINTGIERRLWEEIKKKTGYQGYQTSV